MKNTKKKLICGGVVLSVIVLICSFSFKKANLKITDIDKASIKVYEGGHIPYSETGVPSRELVNWLRYNNSKIFHIYIFDYLPEAIIDINDMEAYIVFHHECISMMKDDWKTFYIRKMEEEDYIFLKYLKSLKKNN